LAQARWQLLPEHHKRTNAYKEHIKIAHIHAHSDCTAVRVTTIAQLFESTHLVKN